MSAKYSLRAQLRRATDEELKISSFQNSRTQQYGWCIFKKDGNLEHLLASANAAFESTEKATQDAQNLINKVKATQLTAS